MTTWFRRHRSSCTRAVSAAADGRQHGAHPEDVPPRRDLGRRDLLEALPRRDERVPALAAEEEPARALVVLVLGRTTPEPTDLDGPVVDEREEAVRERVCLGFALADVVRAIAREDAVEVREPLRHKPLVEREEASERGRQVAVVVEPDECAGNDDLARVVQLDVEAAPELYALPLQPPAMLDPQRCFLVVRRCLCLVSPAE
jgi:hypothetical protein